MWVVRECEDCPIWRREAGSRLRSFRSRGRGASQVALELILTTRVRVIASVCDSQSWGGVFRRAAAGAGLGVVVGCQVLLVIVLPF